MSPLTRQLVAQVRPLVSRRLSGAASCFNHAGSNNVGILQQQLSRSNQSPFQRGALTLQSSRSYSVPSSAVSDDLIDSLEHEIEAEKALEKEQLGGEAAPTMTGWKVRTEDAEFKLSKTHGKEEIVVLCNVNHAVDIEDFGDDQTEETTEGKPIARPGLTVEISKGGNERLCFELQIVDSDDDQGPFDFEVEEFYMTSGATGEKIDDKVYSASGKYIDVGLQDLFFNRYLSERGINAEFCRELVDFTTHYEHAQFVLLLQKIKSFVTK